MYCQKIKMPFIKNEKVSCFCWFLGVLDVLLRGRGLINSCHFMGFDICQSRFECVHIEFGALLVFTEAHKNM